MSERKYDPKFKKGIVEAVTPGWDEIFNEQNSEIKNTNLFDGILQSTRDLSEIGYQQLSNVVQGDGQLLSEEAERILTENPIFDAGLLRGIFLLNKTSKKYANHDMGNWANVAPTMSLLARESSSREDVEAVKKHMKIILESLPRVIFALEDVALRSLSDTKDKEKYHYPLSLKIFYDSIVSLAKSNALKGRLKEVLIIPENFPDLAEDEEINDLNPGAVVNGLFNIIRNACELKIDAEKVELTVDREGDKLVIRVENDGVKQLQTEQLNPNSDNFVFKEGVSTGDKNSKHKGIGLANMDKRFSSMGVELSVVSSKDDQTSFYSNNPERQAKEILKTPDTDFDQADTVFEIRLPITKKE